MFKQVIFDLETNGLYQEVSKIHCLVIKDLETKEVLSFHGDSIVEGISILNNADVVIGHNIVDYDYRVLKKLYPHETKIKFKSLRDTLLLSYMFYPDLERHILCPASKLINGVRKTIGKHSLESWGYHLGVGKIEHEDWSTFSNEMLERCKGDVEITYLLYTNFLQELNNYDWKQALDLEHRFRYIISEQESKGWCIDKSLVSDTLSRLEKEIDNYKVDIVTTLPKRVINQGEVSKPFKKDGTPTSLISRWYNELEIRMFKLSAISGNFTKVKIEPVNLESPKQRIESLLKIGWTPTEYTIKKDKKGKPIRDEKGNPILLNPTLTEDSVGKFEVAGKILDYLTLSHRYKLLKGLEERIREDGCIGSGGLTVAAATGRMQHRGIVNIPRVRELYGKELRSIFSHRPGYVLVGSDLSALENKLIGHYTYDIDKGEYAQRLEKEDPHNRTVELCKQLGIHIDRNKAKTLNYALGFSAQVGKVQQILECKEGEARKVFNAWWEDKKPVMILKEKLIKALESRGQIYNGRLKDGAYIKSLDGRKIYVRSTHSILNSLIQSAGSIINKAITVEVYKKINEKRLDSYFLINYHDEVVIETRPELIEEVIQIIYESVNLINIKFKLKIPMVMEPKVGNNWGEIH